ncbi:MAG: aconitase X catalytic domain-containing protein [Nitrososphaerales archaeon]
MYLTKKQGAILRGEEGWAKKKCLEILVGLGEIYGADRLIPITSTQISGVSYKTLGEYGLQWVESLAPAKAAVPSTLNPAGMDLSLWSEMGIPEDFAEKQMRVIRAYESLGITPLCSCTPYLSGMAPRFGEHVAWSESSAVCYINSYLGARTNREGGPSALASALTGYTANYGLHLDENRKPNVVVEVGAKLSGLSDYSALGYYLGKILQQGVPYLKGLTFFGSDEAKALSAAAAASGGIALFHAEGFTPEARSDLSGLERLHVDDVVLKGVYGELSTVSSGEVDLVAIGCPHTSINELRAAAALVKGKKVAPSTKLWLFTSLTTKALAERLGIISKIEEAGGKVYTDCCMIVAPLERMGFKRIVVNSAKAALYAPTASKVDVVFTTLEDCIDIALKGRVS